MNENPSATTFAGQEFAVGALDEDALNVPNLDGLVFCCDGIPPNILTEPENFVASGGKWGPSGTLGTTGGTVTWSLAGAGWSNASPNSTWFHGTTVALSSFLSFDFTAVLAQAFASWSVVANISFVQVADSGGNMGSGSAAMIRISGGLIDGRPAGNSTLAAAWTPGSAGNAQNVPLSGDINFDSGEGSFWTSSSFLAVATHEIGHSLGLRHTSVSGSLMEPFYNAAITTPQADDIAGIRSIYGMTGAVAGSVSINDVTITEGNAGTQIATFTVSRTGGTAAFAVNFATVNNSALSGSDYVATAGTLSFGSGVNTQTVSVIINGDTTVEPTETFFVNLSAATGGGTISDSQGVGAITNDDAGATNDPNFLVGTPGPDFLMGRARRPDHGRPRRGRHLHRRRRQRHRHREFWPGLGHRHDREPRVAVHPAGERRDDGLAGAATSAAPATRSTT